MTLQAQGNRSSAATASAAPSSGAKPQGQSPLPRALPYADILAFVGSLALILIYSQSWAAPLTGYGARSADFLRNGYYPAYLIAVALVMTRPGTAAKALARSPILILMVALAAASIMWSISPDVTARRVMALIFTTLGGVALAARWRWSSLTEIFAVAMAIMMVGSFLLGAFAPEMGRMQEIFPGAWRGLWLEKNSLGEYMGLATIFMIAAAILTPKRRRIWLALAAMAAGLVLLSTSKTGLVVLILALASMIFVGLVKAGRIRAIIGTWITVVIVCTALLIVVTRSELLFELLGKDATLTGRTEIWSGIIRQVAERPWTGFGYGAAWNDTSPSGPQAWIAYQAKFTAAHAHSGWLEVYLALGIPGVILLGAWMIEMWARSLWAAYTRPSGWLLTPMMTAYTLTMLTESITMNWHSLRWVLFVTLALKAVMGDQETPSRVVPALSKTRRPRRI